LAILSVIMPSLSFPLINTLAIPEILHILTLFVWLMILEHDDTVISLLKRIGL
jgi:hypothetical protein